MKAILLILVIALGGAAFWFQRAAGVAETELLAAQEAVHVATKAQAEAEKELKKATAKIAELDATVSARVAEIDEMKKRQIASLASSPPSDTGSASATPAAPEPAPVSEVERRPSSQVSRS